ADVILNDGGGFPSVLRRRRADNRRYLGVSGNPINFRGGWRAGLGKRIGRIETVVPGLGIGAENVRRRGAGIQELFLTGAVDGFGELPGKERFLPKQAARMTVRIIGAGGNVIVNANPEIGDRTVF